MLKVQEIGLITLYLKNYQQGRNQEFLQLKE